MKLTLSFPELDALRRRMGAPLVIWREKINGGRSFQFQHVPQEWEIGDLGELSVGPGDTITIEGRRVFLYIREFNVNAESFEEASNAPEKLRRFHVSWCNTLQKMKSAGRFERYVASDRVDEPFGVVMQLREGGWACGDTELYVCRNCLSHTGWHGYRNAPEARRAEIVKGFSRRLFLETEGTRFADLPTRTDEAAPAIGYAADWSERSRAYRQSVGWRCEDCSVDCGKHPNLLDTHHQNGVVSDNSIKNLQALCKTCHANRHPNWYKVSTDDHRLLDALRASQAGRGR
jgi:hypothetical protein